VVSVLLIVFWWCWAIQTPPENDEQYRHHQKTMINTDTTRKRWAIQTPPENGEQ
jgi:hypothetical protein